LPRLFSWQGSVFQTLTILGTISIKDYSKLAASVGANAEHTTIPMDKNMHDKIQSSLENGIKVKVQLPGHYEVINGTETRNGKKYYTLQDPGYQKDTHMDPAEMKPFHFKSPKSDEPVYSKEYGSTTKKTLFGNVEIPYVRPTRSVTGVSTWTRK